MLPVRDLATQSVLGGRRQELRGRSILISTTTQLAAASVLLELDGFARRLVVAPPDFPGDHFPQHVIATAEVDAVVRRTVRQIRSARRKLPVVAIAPIAPEARHESPGAAQSTEWVLFTSGTTGVPKMVVHTLATLAGAIQPSGALGGAMVWSTFYDIRRYGGLQIFLRAVLGGGSLVLSHAGESTGDFLERVASRSVTHINGTPSHWRRALMSPSAMRLAPSYVRLSGEIADQGILDALRAHFPDKDRTGIAHAFASTEAGVGFDVQDGLAGFPAALLASAQGDVELKVDDGSLRIRSPRTARRYGSAAPTRRCSTPRDTLTLATWSSAAMTAITSSVAAAESSTSAGSRFIPRRSRQ